MVYRKEIDGLRAFAVLSVMLFHADFKYFSGGFVGVDIFFVISGYLITAIIVSEKKSGSFGLVDFYERRIRRILPALFVVMLVSVIFGWLWLLPREFIEFSESLKYVSLFTSNIFFNKEVNYFDPSTELKPLLHTWSLAVEEQYYLIFPIMIIGLWKAGHRWIFKFFIFIFLASLFYSHYKIGIKPKAAFYLLPSRFWEILAGAIVALYLINSNVEKRYLVFSDFFSILGLLFIGYSIIAFTSGTPFPGFYALIPISGAVLIIIFATEHTIVGRLLGFKPIVSIGILSYGAYLWHQPLFAFCKLLNSNDMSKFSMVFLILLSFGLAYISWKYVEKPFRNKELFNQKYIFTCCLIFTIFFVGLSFIGQSSKLNKFRYTDEELLIANLTMPENVAYVNKRFDELRNANFTNTDSRSKILIIGDSYAQDLINAIFEVGYNKNIQLSTRHIPKECGNLFLSGKTFENNISLENRLGKCNGLGIYEDAKLRKIMLDADEVWFASAWQEWQIPLLSVSVLNTKYFTKKPVKVFGRKNLGHINLRSLLDSPADLRYRKINEVPLWQIKINEDMRLSLSKEVFIDVQSLLCGDVENYCAIFTTEKKLKTFDGTHLTPNGARYYGQKLLDSGSFESQTRYHDI